MIKNNKTAPQYVKQEIILWGIDNDGYNSELPEREIVINMTGEEIDDLYDELDGEDAIIDGRSEVRNYGENTDLPAPYSRHYESQSVAYQMHDGTWVGWTYWYGGGKHGEPESIEWIDNAYFVDCVEKEMLVIVRSFSLEEDNTNANPNA